MNTDKFKNLNESIERHLAESYLAEQWMPPMTPNPLKWKPGPGIPETPHKPIDWPKFPDDEPVEDEENAACWDLVNAADAMGCDLTGQIDYPPGSPCAVYLNLIAQLNCVNHLY